MRSRPDVLARATASPAEAFSDELSQLFKRLNGAAVDSKAEQLTEELRVAEEYLREQLDAVERLSRSVQAAHGRHEELFRFVPEPLIYTDRVGTMRDVNPAGEELLQRERRFLIGKPLAVFIARDDVTAFRRLADGVRAEAPCEDEVEVKRSGGGHERVLLTASLMGASHYILWAARPLQIVPRRVHRSGTYRLPSSSRAGAELAARVNEQLEQSLHDALACAGRLTSGGDDVTQQAGLRLERLLRSSMGLAADLIELTRLTDQAVVIEQVAVDLSALVELTVSGVTPEANARGVVLSCTSRSNLGVEGDHGRLAQALLAVFCHALRGADPSEPINVTMHESEGWAALKLSYLRRPGATALPCESFDWLRAADVASLTARLSLSLARTNVAVHGGALSFACDARGVASLLLRLPMVGKHLD
jgi:PAS domain S-box-containing protein